MDADSLKDPRRKEAAKVAWLEGWALSTDPILAWELAWGRLRELFKKFRKKDRESLTTLKVEQNRLADMREQDSSSWNEEEREAYINLEKLVKEKEFLEASILRRRSRIKLIEEGEANSKYFFACLQSKQAQEKLVELKDHEGNSVTEEDEILSMIHRFYVELYSQPQVTTDFQEERNQLLSLTTKKMSAENNRKLITTPGETEIEMMAEYPGRTDKKKHYNFPRAIAGDLPPPSMAAES
ncbi:hypothetical protein R1sor_012101 [Riccia sorocarpa]|uniref:Uncharacterized protein n=1 Tax=Riccia sorocarpa TaxID=122646 RepID=A0ABD3I2U4_9MARC